MYKRTLLQLVVMAIMMVATASCGDYLDSNNEPEKPLPVEPENLPMFQFNESGIPYRYGLPTIPKNIQESLKKEFIGYGWKWMQTNEILETGYVKHEGYYDGMYGVNPPDFYYMKSDGADAEYVKYFYSDAQNKKVYYPHNCAFNPETGIILNGSGNFRIWTIYKLSGKWFMSWLEPISKRQNPDGTFRDVWAVSQFVRMTDTELKEMQKDYTLDEEYVRLF